METIEKKKRISYKKKDKRNIGEILKNESILLSKTTPKTTPKPTVREFIYKDVPLRKFKLDGDISVDLIKEPGKIIKGDYKFNDRVFYKKLNIIYTDIKPDSVLHENYIKILDRAYAMDYGIEIKPDFIWFTILSEISRIVRNDPETFRKYFTTKSKDDEKIKISAHYDSEGLFDVSEISKKLFELIPSDFTEEMIVPKFTTLTDESSFAFKTTFLETASSYYTYNAYACGYNKVKVYGEVSDYELMINTLDKIENIIPEFSEYFKKCNDGINDVIKNWDDQEFWSLICKSAWGYGVQVIDGWFTKFFNDLRPATTSLDGGGISGSSGTSSVVNHKSDKYKKKYHKTKPKPKPEEPKREYLNGYSLYSFPNHMTKIDYDEHKGGSFSLYSGIFSSVVEDGYVKSQFNKIVIKK